MSFHARSGFFCLAFALAGAAAHAQDVSTEFMCGKTGPEGRPLNEVVNEIEGNQRFDRTLCAEIVALDQALVYNRFGSFNPFGMMFALRRDVVPITLAPAKLDADACDEDLGIAYHGAALTPGDVRLRDCKRPRPLTLRANVGDILHLRMTNMLREEVPGHSESFCKEDGADPDLPRGGLFHLLRRWVSSGSSGQLDHHEVSCRQGPTGSPGSEIDGNWPRTRGANLAIQGLTAFGLDSAGQKLVEPPRACLGLATIAPGESVDCYFMIEREGPFFMASTGAPSGGEGAGGSLVHGLFGAVMAEPEGSAWYRSQVSRDAFDAVWKAKAQPRHARDASDITDLARYEHAVPDPVSGQMMPILNMLRPVGGRAPLFEIVHSDLNAIVRRKEPLADGGPLAFREFSVFFHDELKTFYTRNFEELGDFGAGQLAGVRDGFAINYGASGMGDMLLANRKGIGPAANCRECLYEEFFLTSWANGDPALLEQFSDDPSNVHHSYLNDPVVFRNFHAGPKETHVFHLHAHQWFAGNDAGRGAYLDSQTVAPQQGFTYDIYDGGLDVYHKGAPGQKGWYETLGSGNRNRTPGDSIFHCHLYPHFAQGMWELWRVHDVLEDGSRKLPDGQWEPTLSLAEMNAATRAKKRPGSVDPQTGRWIKPGANLSRRNVGTPIPAIVPLPGAPWPVLPSYTDGDATLNEVDDEAIVDAVAVDGAEIAGFPGYPFYIGGKPGHRPPQAPMDIARELDGGGNVTDEYLDGGLPRHVVGDATERDLPFDLPAPSASVLTADPAPARLADALNDPALRAREAVQSQVIAAALALGDLTMKLKTTQIELLDYDGEPIERTGMGFHHDGFKDGLPLNILRADGAPAGFVAAGGGYESLGAGPSVAELFAVNGSAPKPGAPFADPCGAPAAFGQIERISATSYRFNDGTTTFEVLTVPAGAALTGGANATDAEVSNWVEYRRTDLHPAGPPRLYYVDGGASKEIAPTPYVLHEEDPFLKGLPGGSRFTPDPGVVGYRRYEASAVQVDMITNRAGWHDPQARINVLTANSSAYKIGDGRISPRITATEEPFFFRALSGECIEFRHTNELPKDLELDDFQVRTPTDTIGQHIHLVKFDVTASDGSGNGFNYEDGTLAPGEIATRICTAKNHPGTAPLITSGRAAGALAIREFPGMCEQDSNGKWKVAKDFDHKIWQFDLHTDNAIGGERNRWLFQTTTQRWFADPILSATRAPDDIAGDPGTGEADRTLRTVFSHDHFGPSSIQQHGFYTALLIEPQKSEFCDPDASACTPPRVDRDLIVADDMDVGARKVIYDLLPQRKLDPNAAQGSEFFRYREFALSIADFALLYDPRNSRTVAEVEGSIAGSLAGPDKVPMKGMMTLACEARYGRAARAPSVAPALTMSIANDRMADICGSALKWDGLSWAAEGGDVPPAWLASARPGDFVSHSSGMMSDLFRGLTVHQTGLPADQHLRKVLIDYRAKAAGYDPGDPDLRLASPVSAPARPESISVDHHDPYLVNYRGEPYPLRIGTNSSASADCDLKAEAEDWQIPLGAGVTEKCEISEQRAGLKGDFANALLSKPHGDPATPILNTFDSDPLQIRLIQGAQEVQHSFILEGYNWPRNIDQTFPSDVPLRSDIVPNETLVRACGHVPGPASAVRMAKAGRPDQYRQWALKGSASFSGPDRFFWQDMDRQLANCFNTDGRIAAQEIGISEHFEFRFGLFHDSNLVSLDEDITTRSLRKYVERGRLDIARIPVREIIAILKVRRDALARRTRALDTPYHFGSQDAVWNGAWGLVRVAAPNEVFFAHQRTIAVFDHYIHQLERLGGESLAPAPFRDRPELLDRLRQLERQLLLERLLQERFGQAVQPDLRRALAPGLPPEARMGRVEALLLERLGRGGLRELFGGGVARPQDLRQIDVESLRGMLRRGDVLPELAERLNGVWANEIPQLAQGVTAERLRDLLGQAADGQQTPEALAEELRPLLISPLDTIVNRLPEVFADKQLRLAPRRPVTETVAERGAPPLVPLERFDALNGVVTGIVDDRDSGQTEPRRGPLDRRLLLERKEDLRKSLQPADPGETLKRPYAKRVLDIPEYQEVAGCPAEAPNVYTAIVAIESETAFGKPIRYSDGLHDKNGLFFALVDPRRLLDPVNPELVTDADIEDRKKWTGIELSRIVSEVKRVYSKPEPLVVNVKAGDCVFVVLLNALRSRPGAHPGLADDVGDAAMPRITSLNVERDWRDYVVGENVPHLHGAGADRKKDAVPSARLAVTFPLPVVTSQQVYARPFGHNPIWSLAGIAPEGDPILSISDNSPVEDKARVAQIEQFRFYAGLGFADGRLYKPLPMIVSGKAPEWDFLATLKLPPALARLPIAASETLGDRLGALTAARLASVNLGSRSVGLLPGPQTLRGYEASDYNGDIVVGPEARMAIVDLLRARSNPAARDDRLGSPAARIVLALPAGGDLVPLVRILEAQGVDRALAEGIVREAGSRVLGEDEGLQKLIELGIDIRVIAQRLVPEFKPYAFGALPLKSFGDYIGHPTHGLMGAISVVPQNTIEMHSRAPRIAFDSCENPQILPQGLSFEVDRPILRLDDLGPILPGLIGDRIQKRCDSFVIAPEEPENNPDPVWNAVLTVPGEGGRMRTIRQFTLFWQDGLNLRDRGTMDDNLVLGANSRIVEDCGICDDSYDLGDKGVSFVSEPFHVRLRHAMGVSESHFNLNTQDFGTQFFPLSPAELPAMHKAQMPVLRVEQGEEIVIHVVHPGGRARQRAFATIGQDYDDLFADFGFPRAALLAPGKAITASLLKTARPGCYLWFDGPLHLRAGGVWGLLDIVPKGAMGDRETSSCAGR